MPANSQTPEISNSTLAALVIDQNSIIKFLIVAVCLLALYFQDLTMVFTGALTNESVYHILAVPFIFGYLVYRKRKMVNSSLRTLKTQTGAFKKHFSILAGTTLSAIAITVYWYGSYTFTPLEYHMLTLPFLAAGLILVLFNIQTLKQLLFPIAFLIFLTPPPDDIFYSMGSTLANFSASASNTLANLLGLHASLSSSNTGPIITLLAPNQLSLPFNVGVACSGIYSLIGFTIFAVFIAYITRGSLMNKLIILLMGIPLILTLNIIRITTILAIAYNFGEDLALTLFHSVGATVLMFIGVLLLLAITDKLFKKPKPNPPLLVATIAPTKLPHPLFANSKRFLVWPEIALNRTELTKIVGTLLIVIALLSIQTPVFALTQGPAQVITQTSSGPEITTPSSMLPKIEGYNLSYVYRDKQFEEASYVDAALVYSYSTTHATNQPLWVTIQVASSVTSEHRWETCLIDSPLNRGNPTTVIQLDLRDTQIQANPPMPARFFAFQYKNSNQSEVVLYWYQTAILNSNGTMQTKSVMISLIVFSDLTANITDIENQQVPIAAAINNYWQPIKTWSIFAFALSQNGFALSVTAGAILVALVIYAFFSSGQERKQLLNAYRKMSEENRNIIKAVDNAEKYGYSTSEDVLVEMQKITKKAVEKRWLIEKLNQAQNGGLITQEIANKNDEPLLQWTNLTPTRFNASKLDSVFCFIGQFENWR